MITEKPDISVFFDEMLGKMVKRPLQCLKQTYTKHISCRDVVGFMITCLIYVALFKTKLRETLKETDWFDSVKLSVVAVRCRTCTQGG